MFRLTREVRFAADAKGEGPIQGRNGYAGVPPVTGLGQCYYRMAVSLAGEPDAGGYLVNIKHVDAAVREVAIPLVRRAIAEGCQGHHRGGGGVVLDGFRALSGRFPQLRLEALTLHLTPFTALATTARLAGRDAPMIRLMHTFEFAASHRLHNPALSADENRKTFGKCNNPHGHGHNYQVRVTLVGEADENGYVMDFYQLERVVDEAVIEPLDHKHLNIEVDEFRPASEGGQGLNPSVENIAKVIYGRLRPALAAAGGTLEAVTVWETEKTWCEYTEA